MLGVCMYIQERVVQFKLLVYPARKVKCWRAGNQYAVVHATI